MTIKTKFQKECEEYEKEIERHTYDWHRFKIRQEEYFIFKGEYKGFLKGSLSAFEKELEYINENRSVLVETSNTFGVIRFRIKKLNKNIEFCKKKLEDLKN